jgi:hypothetical protein
VVGLSCWDLSDPLPWGGVCLSGFASASEFGVLRPGLSGKVDVEGVLGTPIREEVPFIYQECEDPG